jgi:broad specificity polyphosphatase/5'/3'-nucleotidase SurE
VTRQSLAFFDDRYRREPAGGDGSQFWIYGEKVDIEESDAFDSRALLNKYITVTPLSFDATAAEALGHLKFLEKT